jgi:hypothetical protein
MQAGSFPRQTLKGTSSKKLTYMIWDDNDKVLGSYPRENFGENH